MTTWTVSVVCFLRCKKRLNGLYISVGYIRFRLHVWNQSPVKFTDIVAPIEEKKWTSSIASFCLPCHLFDTPRSFLKVKCDTKIKINRILENWAYFINKIKIANMSCSGSNTWLPFRTTTSYPKLWALNIQLFCATSCFFNKRKLWNS